MAKGPSFWAADEAAKDAQRKLDEAVKFEKRDDEIRDARAERNSANALRDRFERTGE